MTKLYVFILSFITLFASSYKLSAQGVDLMVSTVPFYTDKQTPYLEIHYKIPTNGLNVNSKLIFTEIVSQADKVIYGDKYYLLQPISNDTSAQVNINHISRIKLTEGEYQISVQVEDSSKKDGVSKIVFNSKIVNYLNKPTLSKIVFCDTVYRPKSMDNFTKNGLNFIPSVLSEYNADIQRLGYYAEVDLDSIFLLNHKTFTLKRQIIDEKGYLVLNTTKSVSKKSIKKTVFFERMDVSSLPKGIYTLELILMDEKENVLSSSKEIFAKGKKRAVQGLNTDINNINFTQRLTKKYILSYLDYLKVSLIGDELSIMDRMTTSSDSVYIKEMFYQLWHGRNPSNPYQAYLSYTQSIDFAENNFKSAFLNGYKTDRGKAYLKHGKPDFITPYMDEPNAYPYEIWQYYSIGNQSNVKYIFYNPTGINNDYILLHSTANREIKNPDWKKYIYRRDAKQNSPNHKGNLGDDADKRFNE
jgi:GWxTD domain-containing protein